VAFGLIAIAYWKHRATGLRAVFIRGEIPKPSTITTKQEALEMYHQRQARRILLAVSLATLFLFHSALLFGVASQIIDLPFQDANSGPFAINNRGQVVGNYFLSNQQPNIATLWQNGQLTYLGTLGGSVSHGRAINNLGQIVGGSETASSHTHAFVWQNGTMTDLGVLPGATDSEAFDINDSGDVVGYMTYPGNIQRPVLWSKGSILDIGAIAAVNGYALGINARGQIVGAAVSAEAGPSCGPVPCHAFLWDHGTIVDLGTLGGPWSGANAINGRGQIVGSGVTASGEQHAFLWQDGVMSDLGTLGGPSSSAVAINDGGQIVGGASDTNAIHAALWTSSGITKLSTPGESSGFANGINARGEIVGVVSTTSDSYNHPEIWIP
jgi:probable HAF family extracellular repeat protein